MENFTVKTLLTQCDLWFNSIIYELELKMNLMPAPDLLNQNLHYKEIPGGGYTH